MRDIGDLSTMNQYNHGQLAGTLAKAPEIRELRNGAKSVRLTIRTYADPNDGPERAAARRANQDVVVGVYVPVNQDAGKYEAAQAGMSATCDFWVESYTYTRDGAERSGQSLNASDVSLVWPKDGGADDDDIDPQDQPGYYDEASFF